MAAKNLFKGMQRMSDDHSNTPVSTPGGGSGPKLMGLSSTIPNVIEPNLSDVHPDPNQARRHFDQDKLNSLAASIAKHGLKNPILVTARPDGRSFEIVAGERRFRAHQQLGRQTIFAIITKGDPEEVGLIDNLQREDLNILEMANGFKRLIDAHQYSLSELGEIVGRSKTDCSRILSTLSLPIEIRAEYPEHAHAIAARTFFEIASAPADTQSTLWERAKAGEGMAAIIAAKRAAPPLAIANDEKPPRPADKIALKILTRSTAEIGKLRDLRPSLTVQHIDHLKNLRSTINELLGE